MEYNDLYDELYHHGTKGMRWGIRRYQNADGSLTPAGKKRRSLGETIRDYRVAKKRKANLAKARDAKVAKQKAAEQRAKDLKAGKIKVKDMTNEELQEHINRINLEKSYKEAIRQNQSYSRGERFLNKLLDSTIDKVAEQSTADIVAQAIKAIEANAVNRIGKSITNSDNDIVFANNKKKS